MEWGKVQGSAYEDMDYVCMVHADTGESATHRGVARRDAGHNLEDRAGTGVNFSNSY